MFIWMVVAFVFILGPLLFVHELGHFWAAKRNGVPVLEFGFGLGPKLVTLFRRGETEYTIRAIPFAAFVRPAGEEDASLENSVLNAPRRVKLAFFAAGPAANIIAMLVLLWVAYLFGPPAFTRVAVMSIRPNSPAEAAGLKVNDLILQADGVKMEDTDAIQEFTQAHLGQEITWLVERDGEEVEIRVTPRKEGEYDPDIEGPIGFSMSMVDTGPPAGQNVIQAAGSTLKDFVQVLEDTVSLPGRVVQALRTASEGVDGADIPPEEDLRYLRPLGIYGILQLIAIMLKVGVTEGYLFYVFRVAGLISMALGITNLLPIPALDGGRILFVVLDWLSECIFHRRINPEREILIHAIGLVLLLVLMAVITWQDIVDPLIQFPTPTP